MTHHARFHVPPAAAHRYPDLPRDPRGCDYCYVDKTADAQALVQQGKAYFLSRPRRFGKSLFVDTLKELFEGNEALFRGLHIHEQWDWSQRHPVILLDFAAGVLQSRAELDEAIYERLRANQQRLGVCCENRSITGCFGELIERAHTQTGQRAVVLIDEYDKPILDNIEHPKRAAELREGLKNLYSVLKAEDAHLRFVFLTGVSKFSKVSLFSGLNQLNDITLDSQYATLCGYTQQDLETTFAEHLAGVDWDRGFVDDGVDRLKDDVADARMGVVHLPIELLLKLAL